jgi:hypothetical protein
VQPSADSTFQEFTVDADALVDDDLATLASKLGQNTAVTALAKQLPTSMDFPDLQSITAVMFEELINDSVARPVYPASAIEMLLSQTPLVQKFATANALQYADNVRRAVRADMTPFAAIELEGACTSTSSSSNACTSTSTSVSITLSE